MAEAYEVSDMTVSWWRKGVRDGRPVQFPSERCPDAERRTREAGQPVLCEELRPDVDWSYLRRYPVGWDGVDRRVAPTQP